jgi:beta-galactosidase
MAKALRALDAPMAGVAPTALEIRRTGHRIMHSYRWITTIVGASIFSVSVTVATAIGNVPVPLPGGDLPVDVARIRVDNPAVISTNGNWRFELTHGAMVDGRFVNQSASASSSQSGQLPDLAIDGNVDTRWCANGGDMPQWWQADLGKTETIAGIKLSWEYSDGHYRYKIEIGPDETHLVTIADQTREPGAADAKLQWPPTAARIVRVTVIGVIDSTGEKRWASIREAAISMIRDGRKVLWSPPRNDASDPHADDFASLNFSDKSWHDLPVPSNWEVLGYSRPTYANPDPSVGLYRRIIDIPASFAGKKVLWHFDGVTDSAELWVNGRHIGYHEGGFTAFDIDVTSAIKPGAANLFAVRVCKTTPTVDLDTGDFWLLGGIDRDSYLVALPTDHVQDVTLVTKLDDQYKNATLLTDVKVSGKPGDAVSVAGQLFSGDGKLVAVPPMSASGKVDEDGSVRLHLQSDVPGPKLWSAEKPNLYYLVMTLKLGDATSEVVQQRFGFRQIDIKDGVLLWNGVAIKCTGTCRHEEWSTVGHALTEHEWQTDIAMMKAANINAVRTSHYNPAERFLELCDEKGLYVLDEVPACFTNPNDPKLEAGFVRNAVETLNRDKNKPCVLAWSCGNESGWGPDFKAMAEYLAANDPTRPRFVSEQSQSRDPALTIGDHHYPDPRDLKKIATIVPGPSVITEGPHLFYNIPGEKYDYGVNDLWGMALANHWKPIWPSKPLFGAFIWEWQDQGLADKYPDKTNVDENGLRSENSKGLVTGNRVAKPELYHVKMVYSPVTTDARQVQAIDNQWPVHFSNRYAFTDLSELICKWQAMTTVNGDHQLSDGEVKLACPPGHSVDATFPVTAGADTLRVSFTNSAGVEIYAVRLHVAGASWPQPPAAVPNGTLAMEDKPDSVGVSSPSFNLQINRSTGRVTISRDGNKVLTGPTLNLGELRIDNGDALNRNDPPWIGSKMPPLLKNISVAGTMDTGLSWHGSVTADVALAEAPDQILGQLAYDLTVNADGKMSWSYHLKWSAADMQAWEFGLKFELPGADDQFSWFRKGQWTEYPPGHIGANMGSVTHEDRSFDSTKRDVVWATVTSRYGGLTITSADGPLHVRCNSEGGRTTLFASSAVSVERSFSWEYCNSTRITFRRGRTYDGAFNMWLIAGK